MTVFDVIVIGAGVEGSATAYQLIKTGAKKILLLEQVKSKLFKYKMYPVSICPSYLACRTDAICS